MATRKSRPSHTASGKSGKRARSPADPISVLLERLDGDVRRPAIPFSEDVRIACEVLLNPYARDDERREVIRGWLTKHQPCVFGRVAAQGDQLYISIVDDKLLSQGERAVKEKIKSDRRLWKGWSLGSDGRHSFILVVLSPRLMNAAPNSALKDFADYIRRLFAPDQQKDSVGNDMAYEWLYLRNPQTQQIHKFRVILDFFASAGDGRWWHDHRFPGGLAYTFNSLGHMARTREWYKKASDSAEWAAKLALATIANAFPHPIHGRATWLLDLTDGRPHKKATCPFQNLEAIPQSLKGKDWTTYQGFHHTDHSVRHEFFDGRENPDRSRGQYLLDFSYIAGGIGQENVELMDGVVCDEGEIEQDIGSVEDLRFAKPKSVPRAKAAARPALEEKKIAKAISICRRWLKTKITL